ncbi:MAG: hypothetical protein HY433_02855 [Candidatus Liptonbacteria bacterium]|nr:hypothetical protein [Candidatus Liptonbacteria bacterium]
MTKSEPFLKEIGGALPAFAKASTFAKATADKSAGRPRGEYAALPTSPADGRQNLSASVRF